MQEFILLLLALFLLRLIIRKILIKMLCLAAQKPRCLQTDVGFLTGLCLLHDRIGKRQFVAF